MTNHKWQFAPRFRRNAFGWKSDTPIQRIKEAITEIKLVAKKEPVLAAEGAILFLEKLVPAIEGVDSSSGAIGSAVNRAIDTLVTIIAGADVDETVRQEWLDRLWEAIEGDGISYIESLGDYWGELCATPAIASMWADDFMPTVLRIWSPTESGHGYAKSVTACLSALFSANRHEELIALLEKAPFKWWHDRRWGAKALASMGKRAEAIRYAEDSKGLNTPVAAIAQFCETVLLSSGFADEAYSRYAIEAAAGTTNLAIFRSIKKKYPAKPPETILRDLVASQPGQAGKWFAAAKDAALFDLAIELANSSPSDPRTLIRAARDFALERPPFAMAAGMTGLRGIIDGYGYDITGSDVLEAYAAVMAAAGAAGVDSASVKIDIKALIAGRGHGGEFVQRVLQRILAEE